MVLAALVLPLVLRLLMVRRDLLVLPDRWVLGFLLVQRVLGSLCLRSHPGPPLVLCPQGRPMVLETLVLPGFR